MNPLKICFIASGNGHVFRYIKRNIDSGLINARVDLVLTDRLCGLYETAKGWEGCRAINLDYPVKTPSPAVSEKMNGYIQDDIDLVLLAYNRMLYGDIVNRFKGRLVNIHPSLLPAFPGFGAIKNTLTSGARFGGMSIHFIDEGIDTGAPIIQSVIPVTPGMDESEYMQIQFKHFCFGAAQTVDWFVQGRIKLDDKRVIIDDAKYGGVPINPAIEKRYLDV